MKKVIVISIFVSLFYGVSLGQAHSNDLDLLSQLNNYSKTKRKFSLAKNNTNEIEFVLSGLFVGYKKFVSSQDGSKCAFDQTCSEYALASIKKRGLVSGVIRFFDRFTRCNTCSPLQYKVNPETNRFEDPAD